jgi:apolipoprotein N-acyltransferase
MFMRSWFEWGVGISAWGIGTDQHNLQVKTTNDSAMLGPIICIESIYPEFVSNTTGNGAEIIVIITNDAWYDNTPGPEQHFLIAAMRAIENRRFIARCANTGVSGIISPTGKTMSRLSQYTRSGLSEPVPRLKEKSIYVLYGDWICKLSSVITILTFIYSLIKSKLF